MRSKTTAILAIATILFISSCSRDNARPAEEALPGKWELSGIYQPGNNGASAPEWTSYKNGLVITIYPDSSYTASGQQSYELTPYTYEGKFYGYSSSDSSLTHRYRLGDRRIKISMADSGQTLLLMGYCTNGCGHRFKRIL